MNEKITMRNTVAEIQKATSAIMKAHPEFMKDTKSKVFYLMLEISKKLEAKKRVTKKEWFDVYSEALVMKAAAEEKPKKNAKKESSLKRKPSKKGATKAEAKEEPKKTTKKQVTKNTSKKGSTKNAPKKGEESKKEVKKPATKKFTFPESFVDKDGAKYTRADDIENYEDAFNAYNESNLVIAFHWTPQLLKEAPYSVHIVPKSRVPKKFENDLDLAYVVYAGDREKYLCSVSMYTDANFNVFGKFIKKSRANGGGRKASWLEYEIYRVEEAEESK